MASLIENLIDVLEQENIEYTKLLELSKKKTQILVKADLDGLQEILGQEQGIIDRINECEKQRETHVADIADVLNQNVKELTLDRIEDLLKQQKKEHDELVRVHQNLKKTVYNVAKINDNNKVLLKESLDMVEFELNVSRTARMAPETANYSREAFNTFSGDTAATSFDAKQ